jgi:hypothetical protein
MKAKASKGAGTAKDGVALSLLKEQFEQWRAGRRVGQRIPPQLWEGAVSASAEHGAYRVSRELGLDYAVLKRRAAPVAQDAPSNVMRAPEFVELFAATGPSIAARAAECVVELANARGAKMRVELSGNALVSLPALCSAFWAA